MSSLFFFNPLIYLPFFIHSCISSPFFIHLHISFLSTYLSPLPFSTTYVSPPFSSTYAIRFLFYPLSISSSFFIHLCTSSSSIHFRSLGSTRPQQLPVDRLHLPHFLVFHYPFVTRRFVLRLSLFPISREWSSSRWLCLSRGWLVHFLSRAHFRSFFFHFIHIRFYFSPLQHIFYSFLNIFLLILFIHFVPILLILLIHLLRYPLLQKTYY